MSCCITDKEKKGYSYQDWMLYTKPYHLNIGDVKNLSKHCTIQFIVAPTISHETLNKGELFNPSEFFFKNTTAQYKHDAGLTGEITLIYPNSDHVETIDNFEFSLECNNNDMWYEFQDGKLKEKDKSIVFEHWEDYSNMTRVGYSGPCILMEDLNKLPMIYF